MNILVINGHDYSRWVEDGGYNWSRDDVDSEKTVRVKTGNMRRDKIAEKRNLTYKMLPMPQNLAAQLDSDLHEPEFEVQYQDLHGQQTRKFYCSKFPANLSQVLDEENLIWNGISFNLHEI